MPEQIIGCATDGARRAHVLEHRQRGEYLRDLKRPGDANTHDLARGQAGDVTLLEVDRSLGRLQMTGNHVDEGGFAGAVGTDHADGLLGRHADGDVAGGYQRAKLFAEIADGEDGGAAHGASAWSRLGRDSSEPSPCGRNRMVSSKTEPSSI